MRYLMLIYGDEQAAMQRSEEEQQAGFAAWMQYDQEINAAGVTTGGEALQPTGTATTVAEGGGGEPLVTDGPFAETREQLGGYYVLDVPNLDEAIKWAHKCAVATDTVKLELRPIMEFDQG